MALFAVALDRNSDASTNERSAAIVGNQWSILDFGGIEEELATKLNDDDIEKVMLCIDAVNKVKRLKLTNCVNITGVGLVPLRSSLIIEQIDLSLVGEHQRPNINPEPQISCSHVLSMLDSIIEREGCSLKYLQFPLVWRDEPSAESEFHAFILGYNQIRGNWEEISCLECNQILPFGNQWIAGDGSDLDYGTQLHTCYDCLKHYCYNCEIDGDYKLDRCRTCDRVYCVDCTKMHVCRSCNGQSCNDCYEYECHQCNRKVCSECIEEGNDCDQCEHCDKVFCIERNDVQCEETKVCYCHECNDRCCDDCRLQRFRFGRQGCVECIRRISPLLVGESKRMYDENEQLKVENKRLHSEIKELKTRGG
jgi:hypothetical protein